MLLPNFSFGQQKDYATSCATKYSTLEDRDSNSYVYYPSRNAICTGINNIKYLNVNFHFVRFSTGIFPVDYNFSKNDDGQGNKNYTGYDRAEDYVNYMNIKFQTNNKVHLPCTSGVQGSNNIAVQPIRIQYVLRGVYFHQINQYINDGVGNWNIHHALGVNKDTEINIYMINPTVNIGADGEASCELTQQDCITHGGLATRIWTHYDHYLNGVHVWESAKLVNHEIGHLMNLRHSWFTYDACTDTEPNNNCWGYSVTNSNCSDPCQLSNNVMDYNHHQNALTPQQITRIHSRMNNAFGNNYVHSCDGCDPVSAFFYLPEFVCLENNKTKINLDGRGSWKEIDYRIEIMEVAVMGSSQQIGNTAQFFDFYGQEVGVINLRALYNFQLGKFYQVRLVAFNECGNGISTAVNWVEIDNTTECYNYNSINGNTSVDRVVSIPSFVEGQLYELRTELRTVDIIEYNDQSITSNLELSPNPTNGETMISFEVDAQQHYRLAIYNELGQEIQLLKEGFTEDIFLFKELFLLQNFPRGKYFVTLHTNTNSQTKQLILN